jgi:hypothetical protein
LKTAKALAENKCPFFILWKGLAEFSLYGLDQSWIKKKKE